MTASTAGARDVVAELLADDEADDVAWRAGVRYTQRIEACTLLDLERTNLARRAVPRVDGGRSTLARTESGFAATGDPNRDVLYWKHDAARELAEDEVDIEVAYWQVRGEGGRREQTAHELTRPKWREFSGRISRVGAAVKGWRTGEPIARSRAVQPGVACRSCVRRICGRSSRAGCPRPSAASLAITAASVNVTLRQMARARRGESVLVVSAAQDEVARMFAGAARGFGLASGGSLCRRRRPLTPSRDGAPLDLRSDEFERLVLAANEGRPVDIVVFCGPVNQALYNRIPLAFGGRVVLHGPAVESVDPGSLHRSRHHVFPAPRQPRGARGVQRGCLSGRARRARRPGRRTTGSSRPIACVPRRRCPSSRSRISAAARARPWT